MNTSIEFSSGYLATPVKTFNQIMNSLAINFMEFTFIDFGSGKGRAILLASKYRFKKIIGIEFEPSLHLAAVNNIDIYKNNTKTLIDIESICADATLFPIPKGQLVIFLFSPFKGKVLKQVLKNISDSFAINKRQVIVIFLGLIDGYKEDLKSFNFRCTEFRLGPDRARIRNYSCLIYENPG